MRLELIKPAASLNKAFRKTSLKRDQIELFKSNLKRLFDRINDQESEEHLKNIVSDFLKDTWYKNQNEINTKGRADLVIHNGKSSSDPVGVIFEVKRPANKAEMISVGKPNEKALHELLNYYLDERYLKNNKEIKHLIITNIDEWYIFDGADFERFFFENQKLIKQYKEWGDGLFGLKVNDWFYKEVARPFIEKELDNIKCTWFNLRSFETIINNEDKTDDTKLIDLYKTLSPEHLLKKSFANDSNTLNKEFYNELLHIIGLEETKEGGKKLIKRTRPETRKEGSLLENTINVLKIRNKLSAVEKLKQYGETEEEQLFSVGLELCLTWLNRILFLKLLEGQLVRYNQGNKEYAFLNCNRIRDYDELNELFFEVLAIPSDQRSGSVTEKFGNLPYLNSSLFEETELEQKTIVITELKGRLEIPIHSATVLKESSGKRISGKRNTLQYLFEFLDAFDFASDNTAEIQEQNKTLINASVLGLIFEKINGYKDGSFFTPGFITMYMCRETIRRAVIQKFNEKYLWECIDITDLYNKIDKINLLEANETINSLKICDPAVGSGHFLVSSLNEIISIKSDLAILIDREGKKLRGYHVTIENDELILTQEDEIFSYNYKDKESQRIQETLFHEKETIIENCLFGVDINPKSVMICRLRLWIELLKNSYYTPGSKYTELETLPNIDINIKCGNSLISRYSLDADMKKALEKSKWTIGSYRLAVMTYRNARSKDEKREMVQLIETIKNDFESEVAANDKRVILLKKLNGELFTLTNQTSLFERSKKEKDEWNKKVKELTFKISKLVTELEEIKSNKIYQNAFEWRFEFPEVLNDEGDFVGFDVVIGNPPYYSLSKDEHLQTVRSSYQTYNSTGDIYCLFYELANNIVRTGSYACFITSNKWMRANYGKELRNYFLEFLNPILLIDFSWYQVFESASVDTNIFLFQRKKNTNSLKGVLADKDFKIENVTEYIYLNSTKLSFLIDNYWNISTPEKQKIKFLFEGNGKTIEKWDINIYRGILTGLNEAFIIDEYTKTRLIEADPQNVEIIKPLIRGRDVERYSYNFQNFYLINSHNGVKDLKIERVYLEKDYPIIYEYLKQFEEKAIQREDKGDHWSNLRNCAYLKEFEKEKLVWAETMRIHKSGDRNFPRFGFDSSGIMTDKTVFIGVGEHIKYLLAFLNSKVGRWLIKEYVTKLDTGGYMMQKIFLDKIPVFEPTIQQEDKIVAKVAQILSVKTTSTNVETSTIEKEIDQLIYELYGLTEEEIKIVEGN